MLPTQVFWFVWFEWKYSTEARWRGRTRKREHSMTERIRERGSRMRVKRDRTRERENKPHQWAGHTALPNCLKKSPLCFIYSALYPWQPERSGKLGLCFTLLWGLGFHRGSQMWGRWARATRCSPTQPSCLLVIKYGPFKGRGLGGWVQRVMGILWEWWFVVMWLGGRRLVRTGTVARRGCFDSVTPRLSAVCWFWFVS